MIEQAFLALFKHLSGKPDATSMDVANTLKGLGFSMEEILGVSPFDVLRTKEILNRLKRIEESLNPAIVSPFIQPMSGVVPSFVGGPWDKDIDSTSGYVTVTTNTSDPSIYPI